MDERKLYALTHVANEFLSLAKWQREDGVAMHKEGVEHALLQAAKLLELARREVVRRPKKTVPQSEDWPSEEQVAARIKEYAPERFTKDAVSNLPVWTGNAANFPFQPTDS